MHLLEDSFKVPIFIPNIAEKIKINSMKRQPLHLVFLLCLFFTSIQAQEYTFGIKGGVNYNKIGDLYHKGGSVSVGGASILYTPSSDMGMHYGAFLNFKFGDFFIRPEVLFTTLKSSYPLSLKTANWEQTRMDIPILVGVEIYWPVSLYLGPTISSISEMTLEGPESPITYEESALGFNVGLMAEMGRFGIDVRYEFGTAKVVEQRVDIHKAVYGTNLADLLEYNPSQFVISVHFNIFRMNGGERRNRFSSDWRNHRNL